MRPQYETSLDLSNEQRIVRALNGRWGVTMHKLSQKYAVDYAVMRDETLMGFIEIKCRHKYGWQFFEDRGYALSLHKWVSANALCRSVGASFGLVVEAIDGCRVYWIGPDDDWRPAKTVYAGRSDRGDSQDQEPMVLLRAARFTPVDLGVETFVPDART